MPVRATGRGRYSGPVTRPTPRAPQLVVRRSTSVLTAGAGRGRGAGPLRVPAHLPAADDGALPAGRRRERHPRRVKVNDLVIVSSGQGPAGRPVRAGRQQRPPAGDVTIAAPGGGPRADQAGRAPAPRPALRRGRRSPATLPTVPVEPGSLVDLTVGTSAAGSDQVGGPGAAAEPVLLDLTPAGSSPSPSATPTRPRAPDAAADHVHRRPLSPPPPARPTRVGRRTPAGVRPTRGGVRAVRQPRTCSPARAR